MSYHELEAEVMRVRGLLAAALEENTRISKERDDAWSKHNWKQRECDGLREKIAAMEAPEWPVSGTAVFPPPVCGSGNSIDALLASMPMQFETLPHEWRAVNVSVEHNGGLLRPGKRFELSLRVSDGDVAINIDACGLIRSELLAPKGAGE
jgi:hypothetical protein